MHSWPDLINCFYLFFEYHKNSQFIIFQPTKTISLIIMLKMFACNGHFQACFAHLIGNCKMCTDVACICWLNICRFDANRRSFGVKRNYTSTSIRKHSGRSSLCEYKHLKCPNRLKFKFKNSTHII